MTVKDYIRDIPDYPSTGIVFRDISPILHNPKAMEYAVEAMYERVKDLNPTVIVGIESRGYIFAALLASRFGVGMATAGKVSGDHPLDVIGIDYAIEVGTYRMEMMQDGVKKGDRVLIVDDLLATGVTCKATADLVKMLGGEVIGFAFLADINYYDGEQLLAEIAPVIHIYDC
jgi:adenine phosphoribosyltransferase